MACQPLPYCPTDVFSFIGLPLAYCYTALAPEEPSLPPIEEICYAVDDAGNFVLDDAGNKIIVPCV